MKKYLKEDHSPLDCAVFAILNSALCGMIFSICLFNKNYEPYNFKLKQRIGFTFRNMLVLSTMNGLNQFLIKFLNRDKNKYPNFLTGYLGIKDESSKKILNSSISTFLPFYCAYKIYYYKNEYILIDKKLFAGLSVIYFIIDYYKIKNDT